MTRASAGLRVVLALVLVAAPTCGMAAAATAVAEPAAGNGAGLEIRRWSIDSGGGTSGNGAGLVLRGSIGQPDVGQSGDGGHVLTGGFWRRTPAPPEAVFTDGFE